jgi:sugar/nucleoside kinase (ribokinase family)
MTPATARKRLVLAGNVIVDVVLRVPRLPERGGDVLASASATHVGGGFNVLSAAARLGLPALYAGVHGTGPFGDRVRQALEAEGVGTVLPRRSGADTGFCVVLVDGEGERTFATAVGAEGELREAEAAVLSGAPRPGDLVQLSGYGLAYPGSGPALAAFASALPAGVLLCLDPGPLVDDIPEELLEPVLARCDWLSCNEREARLLTGLDGGAGTASALAARIGWGVTRTGGGGGALVRGGPQGCWVALRGEGGGHGVGGGIHVPGREVRAVDSNGAGDAHTGAFLAFLARGADPLDAARGANVAASVAVTRHGPATAPTSAELAGLLPPGVT